MMAVRRMDTGNPILIKIGLFYYAIGTLLAIALIAASWGRVVSVFMTEDFEIVSDPDMEFNDIYEECSGRYFERWGYEFGAGWIILVCSSLLHAAEFILFVVSRCCVKRPMYIDSPEVYAKQVTERQEEIEREIYYRGRRKAEKEARKKGITLPPMKPYVGKIDPNADLMLFNTVIRDRDGKPIKRHPQPGDFDDVVNNGLMEDKIHDEDENHPYYLAPVTQTPPREEEGPLSPDGKPATATLLPHQRVVHRLRTNGGHPNIILPFGGHPLTNIQHQTNELREAALREAAYATQIDNSAVNATLNRVFNDLPQMRQSAFGVNKYTTEEDFGLTGGVFNAEVPKRQPSTWAEALQFANEDQQRKADRSSAAKAMAIDDCEEMIVMHTNTTSIPSDPDAKLSKNIVSLPQVHYRQKMEDDADVEGLETIDAGTEHMSAAQKPEGEKEMVPELGASGPLGSATTPSGIGIRRKSTSSVSRNGNFSSPEQGDLLPTASQQVVPLEVIMDRNKPLLTPQQLSVDHNVNGISSTNQQYSAPNSRSTSERRDMSVDIANILPHMDESVPVLGSPTIIPSGIHPMRNAAAPRSIIKTLADISWPDSGASSDGKEKGADRYGKKKGDIKQVLDEEDFEFSADSVGSLQSPDSHAADVPFHLRPNVSRQHLASVASLMPRPSPAYYNNSLVDAANTPCSFYSDNNNNNNDSVGSYNNNTHNSTNSHHKEGGGGRGEGRGGTHQQSLSNHKVYHFLHQTNSHHFVHHNDETGTSNSHTSVPKNNPHPKSRTQNGAGSLYSAMEEISGGGVAATPNFGAYAQDQHAPYNSPPSSASVSATASMKVQQNDRVEDNKPLQPLPPKEQRELAAKLERATLAASVCSTGSQGS